MKSLALILLLSGVAWAGDDPWLLMRMFDTGVYYCENHKIKYPEYLCSPPMCDYSKERCLDFAYMLNEAHERRTTKVDGTTITPGPGAYRAFPPELIGSPTVTTECRSDYPSCKGLEGFLKDK